MNFLQCHKYRKGFWKGASINNLELSHLINIKEMLTGYMNNEQHDHELATDASNKLPEILEAIGEHSNEYVEAIELKITADDILRIAKQKGLRIPASGAGVYIGSRRTQTRLMECFVRFDRTKKLPTARRSGSNSKTRIKGRRSIRNSKEDRGQSK